MVLLSQPHSMEGEGMGQRSVDVGWLGVVLGMWTSILGFAGLECAFHGWGVEV